MDFRNYYLRHFSIQLLGIVLINIKNNYKTILVIYNVTQGQIYGYQSIKINITLNVN